MGFGAEVEQQAQAFNQLRVLLILGVLLVYAVMASQYESLRDPFVVMFSVPVAAIGVVAALKLTSTSFSLQAYIGVIMLGGIVVSNAILLVDYTNILRRRDGKPLREAVELAGRTRLRPILMTTLTTILGLVPMSLGLGEGAELQAPLARVVIGGLAASTMVTLVLVPAVYTLFEEGLTGLRRGVGAVASGASLDDYEKTDRIHHSPGRGRRRLVVLGQVRHAARKADGQLRQRSRTATIVEAVTATGALEPLRRYDVGSQVSGVVKEIYVDYNSIVKKGQLMAEIDPSLLQVQVDIQNANIERQKSDIASQKVQLEDQKKQFERTKSLFEKGLQNQQQYEAAELAIKTREAQIASAEKSLVSGRRATSSRRKLNVSYTKIIRAGRRRRRRTPRGRGPDGAGEHDVAVVLRHEHAARRT